MIKTNKIELDKKIEIFFFILLISINTPMILFSPFLHKTNGLEWIHIFFVVLVPFVVSIITENVFKFFIKKNFEIEDDLSIEDKLIIVKKSIIEKRNIVLYILTFTILLKLILNL